MEKKKLTRRDLLKATTVSSAALASHPMRTLVGTMIASATKQALADDSSVSDEACYVLFQIPGAPIRTTWLPLNPYGNDSEVITNQNIGTCFVQGSDTYTEIQYKTVEINGINMPWIWQFDVPTSDGGSRPMADLMDYMLMLRGIDCGNPAHTGARELQYYPGGMKYSITSLTGDVSDRPFPFIGLFPRSSAPHKSAKSKAGVASLSRSGNWLENLLEPFDSTTDFEDSLTDLDTTLDKVLSNISEFFKELQSMFSLSDSAQEGALTMLKKDFSDIKTVFYSSRTKYRELMALAAAPMPDEENLEITTIEGINDLPVMVDGTDIRQTLADRSFSQSYNMAEQFTVLEYVLVNRYSTCLSAGLGGIAGFNTDEHNNNPLSSVYHNNLFNRQFAACALELISILQAEGLWDKTLLSIGGEFGRKPKASAVGSDHDEQATDVTYFSPKLVGNQVCGNIVDEDTSNSKYSGTWGRMAENDDIGYLTTAHIAATTADLLGFDSPVTSTSSLLKKSSGKYSCTLGNGKIIKKAS